jgi:hypothetical protein
MGDRALELDPEYELLSFHGRHRDGWQDRTVLPNHLNEENEG